MTAPCRRLVWLKKTISETDVCCWCCTLTVGTEIPEHSRLMWKLEDDQEKKSESLEYAGQHIKYEIWGNCKKCAEESYYSFLYTLKWTVSWAPVCQGVVSWNRKTGWGERQLNDMKHLSGMLASHLLRSLHSLLDGFKIARWHILQLDKCVYSVYWNVDLVCKHMTDPIQSLIVHSLLCYSRSGLSLAEVGNNKEHLLQNTK